MHCTARAQLFGECQWPVAARDTHISRPADTDREAGPLRGSKAERAIAGTAATIAVGLVKGVCECLNSTRVHPPKIQSARIFNRTRDRSSRRSAENQTPTRGLDGSGSRSWRPAAQAHRSACGMPPTDTAVCRSRRVSVASLFPALPSPSPVPPLSKQVPWATPHFLLQHRSVTARARLSRALMPYSNVRGMVRPG